MNKFMPQIKELLQHLDAVAFWQEHRATYSCLADTALDFSQPQPHGPTLNGFFSVCGMLSQGCRNRMSKSLEMPVRLKLNVKMIGWLGWQTFYLLYSDFENIRHKTFSISCFIFIYVSTAFLTWLVYTTWLISLQLHIIESFLPW